MTDLSTITSTTDYAKLRKDDLVTLAEHLRAELQAEKDAVTDLQSMLEEADGGLRGGHVGIVSDIRLNKGDEAVPASAWVTFDLERGATFSTDDLGNDVVVGKAIERVVPWAKVDHILGLVADQHRFTAENTLDGAIYGANAQLKRRLATYHSQQAKIRAAVGAAEREGDPDERARRVENIERMCHFGEDLAQQLRELEIIRAAYKLAWQELFDGEMHRTRAQRMADRGQEATPAELAQRSASVQAALGFAGGAQVGNAGAGDYRPVRDGTVSGDSERREPPRVA